jgi:hypothetical protein
MFPLFSWAQGDSTRTVSSPYKTEYNPWFKLTTFQRGYDSKMLKKDLDSLESRPRKEWSRYDSLNFAEISLKTGKLELASYYFDHLDVDFDKENKFWWSVMVLHILTENYDEGIESIHKNNPGILERSEIYFLDKFLVAYRSEKANPKWYKDHSVLKWEVDSTVMNMDKFGEEFEKEVIIPLQNLNKVIKLLVHYIHEDDPVLSRACFEMGVILEHYISYTEAYNAYSLGRHYNKWDKEILNAVKAVKAKMTEKKYKIPIFRRLFPTKHKWRFDYELLKQKVIREKNDTIPKFEPQLIVKQEKKGLGFPLQYITISGILILFLIVLLFIKTRKK